MTRITGFLAVACLAMAAQAIATPLQQVKQGRTIIEFNEDLAQALASCEVARIKQGNLKPDGSRLRLPVTGGALDTDALAGELQHGGGINVYCPALGDGPVLGLQNFTIELPGEAPVVTALVTVVGGDEPVQRGRLALFSVSGDELSFTVKGKPGKVDVSGAELGLTESAAALLEELGIVVAPGTVIGEASSRFNLRSPDKVKPDHDDDDDDDDDDEEDEEEDEEEDDD